MRLSLHNYHAGSSDGTSWSAFISGINAGIDRRIAANAVRLISESQQFAERQAALGVEIERAQRDGDQHALESAFAARAAFRVPGYLVPEKIPKTFTLSLLRDVFINNAYTSSGFNVFIAQAAAGHRSGSAIRDYLRNQTRRRQNYARGRHFQDHLFQEMRRGVVDPVILRKLMDDGEITEEQRHRWLAHRDRTRQGMGCRNPKRPPIEIAPEHKEGHDCRVQRCIICQLGLVFEDSVDPLSCRIAELLSIQMSMSLPVWEDSSFKLELAVTQATLGQAPFNAVEVAKRVQFWIEEIHSGRHLVADMEGTYA